MDTIDFDFKTSGYDLTGEPEDEFLYKGKAYGCIGGLPSIKLPADNLVKFKNPIGYFNSAYHAPYTCKWIIENGKLYLTELKGTIVNPCSDNPDDIDDYKSIDLNYLYPDKKNVFADWYSGKISLVSGFYEIIRYSKDGKRIFPKVLHLTIENGILINEEIEYSDVSFRDKMLQFIKFIIVLQVFVLTLIFTPINWLFRNIKNYYQQI